MDKRELQEWMRSGCPVEEAQIAPEPEPEPEPESRSGADQDPYLLYSPETSRHIPFSSVLTKSVDAAREFQREVDSIGSVMATNVRMEMTIEESALEPGPGLLGRVWDWLWRARA